MAAVAEFGEQGDGLRARLSGKSGWVVAQAGLVTAGASGADALRGVAGLARPAHQGVGDALVVFDDQHSNSEGVRTASSISSP